MKIDVGRNLEELPLDMSFRSGFIHAAFQGKDCAMHDPIPDTKVRKPLYLLLTFESGARRLIARTDMPQDSKLINMRVEQNSLLQNRPEILTAAITKASKPR